MQTGLCKWQNCVFVCVGVCVCEITRVKLPELQPIFNNGVLMMVIECHLYPHHGEFELLSTL